MTCCESPDLFWFWSHKPSDVPDGQLRYHDISPIINRGCEHCGDMLESMPIDEFLVQVENITLPRDS